MHRLRVLTRRVPYARSSPTLLNRNDCTVLGENFTDALQSGSRDFFAGTIALGFMLYISIPVTFVALLVVPSTTYLSFKYGEYQRRIGKVTQESIGEMTKVRPAPSCQPCRHAVGELT